MAAVERSNRSKLLNDRISNLPGPILSQILSLLSTKEAVATSVLSTKSKFLWTSITNLHFDNEDIGYGNKKKVQKMLVVKFTQFVNRVFLLLNPPCIKTFRLNFTHKSSDLFYLTSWISAAIGRNVQKLDLNLTLEKPLELPLTHSCCNTLVVLKLHGSLDFNIHSSSSVCLPCLQSLHLHAITFAIAEDSSVNFPNLKHIKLWFVTYANEDSVHKLFSSSPVLQELSIFGGNWENVSCLIIRIPSLRRLRLDFLFRAKLFELQIDTPTLQYLNIYDRSQHENLTAGSFSSLLEAKIQFDFDPETMGFDNVALYNIAVCKFIEQLSRVRSLKLLGHSLEVVRTAPISIFQAFHNLKRVKLEQHKCQDWQVVVNTLLPSMDNLEHLVMKGGVCCGSHESWWIEPLNVPKCLQCRVTTIHFTNMNNCSDELELSRYFLKNAKALKRLEIHSRHSVPIKFKMSQKISMFPRGSDACQVAFM